MLTLTFNFLAMEEKKDLENIRKLEIVHEIVLFSCETTLKKRREREGYILQSEYNMQIERFNPQLERFFTLNHSAKTGRTQTEVLAAPPTRFDRLEPIPRAYKMIS